MNPATMTLEERITRLEDIEAIRQLQARYQRCLDCRDFEGLEECFTDDVDASYDNARESYKSKAEVMKFLRSVMTTDIPSSHLIHGGEIDVQSPVRATAKWYLEDFLLHRKFLAKLHGTAIYDVEYEAQTKTPQPPKGGDFVGEGSAKAVGEGNAKAVGEGNAKAVGEGNAKAVGEGNAKAVGEGNADWNCKVWKIKKIGYTRCYEYFELRGLVNILTLGKTTFLDLFKKKNKGKDNEGGIKAHIKHFTK